MDGIGLLFPTQDDEVAYSAGTVPNIQALRIAIGVAEDSKDQGRMGPGVVSKMAVCTKPHSQNERGTISQISREHADTGRKGGVSDLPRPPHPALGEKSRSGSSRRTSTAATRR